MKRPAILAGVLFVLIAFPVSAEWVGNRIAPRQAAADTGGKMVGGLECTVASAKPQLISGTLYEVSIVLKNVTDGELAVPRKAYRGISLTNGDGRTFFQRSQFPHTDSRLQIVSAKEMVRIKPGEVYKFKHTVYLAKEQPDSEWMLGGYLPPLAAGKYQMRFNFGASYSMPRGGLDLDGAKPWMGTIATGPAEVSVVSVSPQETVARLMIGVNANDVKTRKLSMWAISYQSCRLYGKNDGEVDSIRKLRAWWQENKTASRQQWIAASLASNDEQERQLAAKRVHLVTDPQLRKKLLDALDRSRPEESDLVFSALWMNYRDREAFAYAREVLGEKHYQRRYKILAMVRDHKIDPLREECQTAFLEWLKTEKHAEPRRHLISAAGSFDFKKSVPLLNEIDRKGQGPFKELIIALTYLQGKAYEPRLVEHLRGKSDQQRLWAAWCLFGIENKTAATIDALIQTLSDPNAKVRHNTCYALQGSGLRMTKAQSTAATNKLIEMLASDDKVNRYQIHNTLVRITGKRPPNGANSADRRKAAAAWRGANVREKM